ncbi:MAG: hypothetical protein K2J71_00180 [Oscillospiraceae bacterium]|nr:hypothetical protein [Oscillospiraceae bacterium]
MKKTLALLLSLTLVSMNFSAVATVAEDSVQASQADNLYTVTAVSTYGDNVILNGDYRISLMDLDQYSEISFSLKYGDVLEIDCDTILETSPKRFAFESGDQIKFLGKAEDYYKDNLEELVAVEVQDEKILLAEKNPEDLENPVIYELDKTHLSLKDGYFPMLDDFNIDKMEVNDYGVFAVNPDTQKAICAVEFHYGNPIDTSQTIELQVWEVWGDGLILKDMETEKYYNLELKNKAVAVMDKKTLRTLSVGDVLLLTVDSEGNPEIPLEVTYEATVEDFIQQDKMHTVIGVNEDGTDFFLDNDCTLSVWDIEYYAETSFTPKYGDLICVDCDFFLLTFPGQFALKPGVRIYYVGKSEDYYKDNLKELVVTEVQDYKIILAEKNPENPENAAVYQLNKVHPRVDGYYWMEQDEFLEEGYYWADLDGFDVDTLAVGDSGIFAVNPDTQKVICAVEVHYDYDNAIDTSQTAEFKLINVRDNSISVKNVETGEYHLLLLNHKVTSVMSKETLLSLSGGDILRFTVDSEGNPEIPLEVTYEATVEDFIRSGMLYTVIGVSEDGTEFFLNNGDNDCKLSVWEIEDHAETPFTPKYGDLICVDCNCFLETFPMQFGWGSGVQIYPIGKAGDYYKDDLKELVVTEVQDHWIILAEENPENPENVAVYELDKIHPWVEDYYSAELDGFDLDTLAVGDSGIFAVNPDKNTIIAAVEIHTGENSENSGNSPLAKGDVNGDGKVDIADVILINRVYVDLEKVSKEQQQAGDIDKSGKLDLADAMLVMRYLVGLEDSLDF